MTSSKSFQKALSLLLIGSAGLFFLPLGLRALWDSDEGRYAEIAREMLQLGDWVTPHLNYVVYFEKPPLLYWLTALSFKVFGYSEFAARFWCAVFGLGTVYVTALIGRRWRGDRAGWLAGAMLATSVGFFALTQFLVLDMVLTFWTTLALYAVVLFLSSPVGRQRALLLFAGATAIGTLIKGPVALILPLLALAAWMACRRRALPLKHLSWKEPVILWMAIVLPWFILVSWRNPYFPEFFFIHEHIQRYLTSIHHRAQPFYFFIPVVLGGFLPWSVFLPTAFVQQDDVGTFLTAWCGAIFLFFSLSQSKLAGYILPIFPALALLAADRVSAAWPRESMVFPWSGTTPARRMSALPDWMGWGLSVLTLLFAGLLFALKWPGSGASIPEWIAVAGAAMPTTFVLGVAVFLLIGVWGMRQVHVCIVGILAAQVLFLWTLAAQAPVLTPFQSAQPLAEQWRALRQEGEPLIVYRTAYETYFQTLPYYAETRVAVWGPYGELQLGHDHAVDAAEWFVPDNQAQAALPRLAPGAWLATDTEHAAETASGGRFRIMGQSGRFVLLRKVR